MHSEKQDLIYKAKCHKCIFEMLSQRGGKGFVKHQVKSQSFHKQQLCNLLLVSENQPKVYLK